MLLTAAFTLKLLATMIFDKVSAKLRLAKSSRNTSSPCSNAVASWFVISEVRANNLRLHFS